jgi:hypothetical protein
MRKIRQMRVRVTIMPSPGINNPKLVPLLNVKTMLNPGKMLIIEFCDKNVRTLNFEA